MDVVANVLTFGMINGFVGHALAEQFIMMGVVHGLGVDALNDAGDDFTAALNRADDERFIILPRCRFGRLESEPPT